MILKVAGSEKLNRQEILNDLMQYWSNIWRSSDMGGCEHSNMLSTSRVIVAVIRQRAWTDTSCCHLCVHASYCWNGELNGI